MHKLNTEQFIKKAINKHGLKYDYSKVIYINTRTNVIIICKEHGEFLQIPHNHLAGKGCLICSKRKQSIIENFIKRSTLIHGGVYDYSKVEYVNISEKITIICSIHGEFQQIANNHLAGHGCIKCGGCAKLSTAEFISKAKIRHGDKYDYSMVDYINAIVKVTIICKLHGEFLQIPYNHLAGKGCAKCGGSKKLNNDEFIRRALMQHGNKYDYSKSTYVNCNTKITIICYVHGEFKQKPVDHLRGNGCLLCGGSKKLNNKEFIKRSRAIHKDKYDYSKVNYINVKTKIIIICNLHGEFIQQPRNHLRGYGCIICGSVMKLQKIKNKT